jgi:hypothetical protein
MNAHYLPSRIGIFHYPVYWYPALCTKLLVRPKHKIILPQTPERFLAILGECRLPDRCKGSCEEARLPLLVLLFPLSSLGTLLLFDFLLEGCGERVLLVNDGVCDAFPELARLIRELLFDWGDVLWDGEKRI